MSVYEFNQEVYDQTLREDGEAIGMEKGIEIGTSQGIEIGTKRVLNIYSKIQQGETDNKIIAESRSCTVEEVEKVREQLEK